MMRNDCEIPRNFCEKRERGRKRCAVLIDTLDDAVARWQWQWITWCTLDDCDIRCVIDCVTGRINSYPLTRFTPWGGKDGHSCDGSRSCRTIFSSSETIWAKLEAQLSFTVYTAIALCKLCSCRHSSPFIEIMSRWHFMDRCFERSILVEQTFINTWINTKPRAIWGAQKRVKHKQRNTHGYCGLPSHSPPPPPPEVSFNYIWWSERPFKASHFSCSLRCGLEFISFSGCSVATGLKEPAGRRLENFPSQLIVQQDERLWKSEWIQRVERNENCCMPSWEPGWWPLWPS